MASMAIAGIRKSAPVRKQRPPRAVPRLTSMMLRGSPVVGTTFDATQAEIKALALKNQPQQDYYGHDSLYR